MSSSPNEIQVPMQKKQEISFLKKGIDIKSRSGLKIMASDNVKLIIAEAIESFNMPIIASFIGRWDESTRTFSAAAHSFVQPYHNC
jgi:hypothetical protein